MKKLFSVFTFTLFLFSSSFAQKVAYVDLDYILNSVPEYKSAQEQLDKISIQWQKEIETKLTEVDRLYKAFQSEEILLTQDMKKKREDEIITKEKVKNDATSKDLSVFIVLLMIGLRFG